MSDRDLDLIIKFVFYILSTIATACSVNRKGRSKAWVFFAVFFPPLFLIVELLPNKNKRPPTIISCHLCHKDISSEVRKCPHCGHVMPREHSLIALIYERIICVVWIFAVISFILNLFPNNPLAEFQNPLPKCNSQRAKDSIQQTFENSQLRRNFGLSIVSIDHIETINNDSDSIHCKAQVDLNNTTTHTMKYKFYQKNDDVYTEFELVD